MKSDFLGTRTRVPLDDESCPITPRHHRLILDLQFILLTNFRVRRARIARNVLSLFLASLVIERDSVTMLIYSQSPHLQKHPLGFLALLRTRSLIESAALFGEKKMHGSRVSVKGRRLLYDEDGKRGE